MLSEQVGSWLVDMHYITHTMAYCGYSCTIWIRMWLVDLFHKSVDVYCVRKIVLHCQAFLLYSCKWVISKLATCLENGKMSKTFTAVRKVLRSWPEKSGKCQGRRLSRETVYCWSTFDSYCLVASCVHVYCTVNNMNLGTKSAAKSLKKCQGISQCLEI